MRIVICSEDACILRSFLKERLHLSTRAVSRLKQKPHGILLNGAPVTVRAQLRAGDELTLALDDEKANDNLVPSDLPLSILYEDDALVLCNKESGMPTHPSHGHYEDTLANALAHRYASAPFIFRAITRLDRETSGVVLVARDAHSAHLLSEEMQGGGMEKVYFALVEGTPPASGEIALPIRRKPHSVMLREIHEEGAHALTRFRRLSASPTHALLAVFPQTGRTHQIRLHLSHMGFPIVGDALYGREGEGFARTMLHAARLSFRHPASGAAFSVFAPLPEDFLAALDRLSLTAPTEKDTLPTE